MISASPKGAQSQFIRDITYAFKTGGEGEAAHTPDLASEIDSEEEIFAERFGVNLTTAREILEEYTLKEDSSAALARSEFAKSLAILLDNPNNPVIQMGVAAYAGLDQLNGIKSQAEGAKRIGKHRASVSHVTTGCADLYQASNDHLQVTKYRKSEASREVFRAKATDPFTAAKLKAIKKAKQNQLQPCN